MNCGASPADVPGDEAATDDRQEDTVIFPTGHWSRGHPTFAIRKSNSNTLRKVLEKRVDAGENRRAQKTKAMPRTLTIVLMTNPSCGSMFYFRRREGERYDRIFFAVGIP